MRSVEENDETIVPAGNMLGKDFISGLIALWFFISRYPCRVVTSSVDVDQLRGVLWGEMRRFIQTSRFPLTKILLVNDLMIRRIMPDGTLEPRSEIIGRVTKRGEGMLGRHIEMQSDGRPRTLIIFDEASAIDDEHYEKATTWAQRILIIGNCYPCNNFFKLGVKEGDIKRSKGEGYYRRIIRIKADDSPNVQLGRNREVKGLSAPSMEMLIPGLIDWPTYSKRRALWHKVRQCVSLDGEFYEGAEVMLFPAEWLNRAESIDRELKAQGVVRRARTIGIDTAEGGDDTVWTVVDELGILEQISLSTADTSVIGGRTVALMRKWQVLAENVLFDRGGGGQQHADYLRARGYIVRTVAFGVPADPDAKKSLRRIQTKAENLEEKEVRYVYKNRRAEMYGLLRQMLTPPSDDAGVSPLPQHRRHVLAHNGNGRNSPVARGFAIPAAMTELRRQLAPIPLLYDGEGRLYLPPKDKKNADSPELTLKELLGCSPDEADSLVLAVFGLHNKMVKRTLGAAF